MKKISVVIPMYYEEQVADECTNRVTKVLKSIKDEYDYVFHLATYHGNQSSIFFLFKDHENNTLTTLKLFEILCKFKNIKKVVYSSAGCSVAKKTFDEAVATTEESPIEINMDSPYSISKLIGEFYSNYYYQCLGKLLIYVFISLFIGLVVAKPCKKLNQIIEKSKEHSGVMI